MGEKTGIAWTSATVNFWWGCTKVGPACDDCYAEGTDRRSGGAHWGSGVLRRKIAGAPALLKRLNARSPLWDHSVLARQPVFIQSMSDLFDNEVDLDWFREAWVAICAADRLAIQICTKRASAVRKRLAAIGVKDWPDHVGLLITVVTQQEADRDVPRLLSLKRQFDIPWVGISCEPAQELIDFRAWLPQVHHHPDNVQSNALQSLIGAAAKALGGCYLDWIIFGGKSGRNWNDRPFDLEWGRVTRDACRRAGVPFFFKQVAAFRPTDNTIPPDLMVRKYPRAMVA